MALQVGELFASLDMETSGFENGIGKAEGGFGKLKGLIVGLGIGAVALKIGKDMVMAAANAEEMQSKFDTVFGSVKGQSEAWASGLAKDLGRSTNMIKTNLADNQGLLTGLGMTREAAAKMSQQMIATGFDLASFNNLEDQDAIERVSKAMMGQHDVADALGAKLNETTLAETMHQMGLKGTFQALSEAEKMTVRYNTIVRQNKDAIGDAAKTQGSFTNQMKRLKSIWDDFLPLIGGLLLPLINGLLSAFNALLAPIVALIPVGIQLFKDVFGGGAVQMEGFKNVIENLQMTFSVMWDMIQPVLMELWTFVMALVADLIVWFKSLQPVFIEIAAAFNVFVEGLRALLGRLLKFWKDHGDKILAYIKYLWDVIKAIIEFGLQIIRGLFTIFGGILSGDWSKIWAGIKIILSGAWDFIKNIFKAAFTFVISIVKSEMNRVKEFFTKPMDEAKDKIFKIIEAIKGFFSNLSFKFPSIKLPEMPKPKITGSFGVNPPSVPKFSWFAKGGMFDKPSIVGLGERGTEAIVPLGNNSAAKSFAAAFMDRLQSVGGLNMAGGGGIVVNVTGGTKDPRLLAQEISREIARQTDIRSRVKGR